MTVYYVGSGGNDANAGTSWALRKLTLNGAEDIPVVAGDTVYVAPGTYREMLTVDVSGSVGSPITYAGDYTGQHTDGVGGIVRITGSDNDQTAARADWITASSKNYRTFTGFAFDISSSYGLNVANCTDWTVQQCSAWYGTTYNFYFNGTQANHLVENCGFLLGSDTAINFAHTSVRQDNCGNVVNNCLFVGFGRGVNSTRIGGITMRNCTCFGTNYGMRVDTAINAGQTVTINNCLFAGCATAALQATAVGEITENYNNFYRNTADRVNTNTGANSLAYPMLFDPRWLLQLMHAGAGSYSPIQLAAPFDLASFSPLLNIAGTSPTATDLRGTAVQGAQREWGALEYDATLKIRGGIRKSRAFGGF